MFFSFAIGQRSHHRRKGGIFQWVRISSTKHADANMEALSDQCAIMQRYVFSGNGFLIYSFYFIYF